MTNRRAPVVTLQKDLARSLRRGHPWIYRDALRAPADASIAEGAPVAVATKDGRPMVWGYWDAESPIAVRVLAEGRPGDARALVRERLQGALDRRLERIDLAQTNAFRWIHGEGDRLPGVHVD